MKTIVNTVRNVGVATFVVGVLGFLFFIGNLQPNNVVAQSQAQVLIQEEEEKVISVTPKPVTQDHGTVTLDHGNYGSIVSWSSPVTPKPVTLDQELPKPLTQEQLEAIAIQPATINKETGSRVVPAMLPLFEEKSITYTGKEKYKDTVLKYRLHVPENIEQGKKYPLILWLHGAGEIGDDNKLQLVHLHHVITYLTGEKKRDFFLLVPQAPKQHAGWEAYSYNTHLAESLAKQLKNPEMREKILKQYETSFGSETKTSVSITEIDGETVLTVSEPFEDSPIGFSFAMLDQVIQNYPVDTDRITVSGLSTGGDGTWRALERRPELFAA
ncbi:MAG: hypothetical protein LBC02_02830, partial [Planctomycetaceae bacterium]|nr:hypothetical protein [Planctomycetaceae bacterium]